VEEMDHLRIARLRVEPVEKFVQAFQKDGTKKT